MEEKILDLIKEHKRIIIARHIGGDPDALGATFAMKEIIEENFDDKQVSVVGASISRFKIFGTHEKMTEEMYDNALLIALDIPDVKRIDGVDFNRFNTVVKIDHHPEIDKFSEYQIIDENASSASEIIALWCYKCGLKMPKHAAENIFMGIVADTNRFLFQGAGLNTFKVVVRLIEEQKINPTELYALLYNRSISEVRLEGFISQNMKITKNGAGYIKITDKDLKEFNVDSASVGSIMNNYNFIEELLTWVVFTEDVKNSVIRTSARSRGPVINKLFEQYNGGGHIYACGAKLKNFSEADEIIDKLDELCKEYKNDEED
ncbi:MAG: bifunctional oligoribonuclease/PAP phosphatase NrnA [Bacilli bacterium]|nr:bifunctional oligoribonuclease/PAP phosphatase NrnA [Bacilli bacterium]